MALMKRVRPLASRPFARIVLRTATNTTRVDVANIRLQRPKPKDPMKWVGLEGLDQRTTGSLVPDTLAAMAAEPADVRAVGREELSREERLLRRRALDKQGLPGFNELLKKQGLELTRAAPKILQLNVGLYCNQACSHCHVDSSPRRKETMSAEVAQACLAVMRASPGVTTLDLTGGAPELQPQFRPLVQGAVGAGVEVIDRCNLTVIQEPGQEDLVEFLAAHKVHVVASLPCYGPKNVNTQRGSGVFDRSIRGLLRLNEAGYGVEGSGLVIDLVYNPLGAFLPPEQQALEAKYKDELNDAFGIVFNRLYTITNLPILRFADFLHRRGELEDYMQLLVQSFNPAAVEGLMCRDTVNVRWDGQVFDCDFNQQLGLGLRAPKQATDATAPTGVSILDIQSLQDLATRPIATGTHCYGCTAGQGSSCQGATV